MIDEFVRRLFPPNHVKFQGWCVSAVAGELEPKRLTKLENHIRGCESCQEFLQDMVQVNLQFMPAFWNKSKPTVSVLPPEGMRARFLEKLKRQKMWDETAIPIGEIELPLDPRLPAKSGAKTFGNWKPWRFLRPVPLAGGSIAILLFAGGYFTGSRLRPKMAPSDNKIQAVTSLENRTIPANTDTLVERKEELLRSMLADLERERALALKQRQAFGERIADSEARLVSLRKESSKALEESREDERVAKDVLAAAQKENEALRRRISEADALLTAKGRQAQELENELQITRGSLQARQETVSADQQLAKGQLSDLVTARNLHIVDVYDADGDGHRKASFGRVFYVEGKSLLFYAYDLQDVRQVKANVAFHTWGGRAGTKEVTHSLGILRNENPGQGLWTLTFDDPSVLAKINSVFVTAESENHKDSVPHGRKILYAYLGNPPNHP